MKKNKNNLDFLAKCNFCGSQLEHSSLTILESVGKNNTFHVVCDRCQTAAIIFFSVNQSGMMSVGVATDLDRNEVKEKFLQEAISANEVLEAYQFISKK